MRLVGAGAEPGAPREGRDFFNSPILARVITGAVTSQSELFKRVRNPVLLELLILPLAAIMRGVATAVV